MIERFIEIYQENKLLELKKTALKGSIPSNIRFPFDVSNPNQIINGTKSYSQKKSNRPLPISK